MIYRVLTASFNEQNYPSYSQPTFGGAWMVGGVFCDVPFPNKKNNHKAKFFFTEKGWRNGRNYVLQQIREMGLTHKIICRKNPKRSEIVYQDKFQVAVLPRR